MTVTMKEHSLKFFLLLVVFFDPGISQKFKCLPEWKYGYNCGKHSCYRVIPVPMEHRLRMIDDNYCLNAHPKAFPASIHCQQENDFLVRKDFISWDPTKVCVAIGLYIPLDKAWHKDNFVNRDGTKVDYTSWGIWQGKREPNGWYFKDVMKEKVVRIYQMKDSKGVLRVTWHDQLPTRETHVYCKMPADMVPGSAPPITKKPVIQVTTKPKTIPKPSTTKRSNPKPLEFDNEVLVPVTALPHSTRTCRI